MKKFITILLSIMLICAIGVTTFGATIEYTDKDGKTQKISDFMDTQGHWAHDVILKWADYNLVAGNQGNFMPNNPIKRGDLCVILDRMLGLKDISYNYFYDLSNNEYYTEAVLKCVAAGYISGTSATTVDANGKATREQVATIIYRMFDLDSTGYQNVRKFNDDYNIGSWAREAVYTMRKYGYMNGNGNNMFNPKANITRAEFIQVMNNIAGTYMPKKGGSTGNSFMSNFSGNLMLAKDIVLTNSTVSGNIIVTPNARSLQLNSCEIQNQLFIMSNSNITLGGSKIKQIYLQSGRSQITGISNKIESVYICEAASESSLDDFPTVLYLEGGTRVRISGTMYENSTNEVKEYKGLEVKADIAAEQGFVVGGPKLNSVSMSQTIYNELSIDNMVLVNGNTKVKEIGLVWLNQNDDTDVIINPTYQNNTGKKVLTKNVISNVFSFPKLLNVEGHKAYRIYVIDENGLFAYSKSFEFKEYDFDISMKIIAGENYPDFTDVEIEITGNNIPAVARVEVTYDSVDTYNENRSQTTMQLYKPKQSEYTIDNTKYLRYIASVQGVREYDPINIKWNYHPASYYGYIILFTGGTIINQFPILSNEVPVGASPVSDLKTGYASFNSNGLLTVFDNSVQTSYVAPQEYGIVYNNSVNVDLSVSPTPNVNGWKCVPVGRTLGINQFEKYSCSIPLDSLSNTTYYAAYIKTSNGYWFGDIESISNDYKGDKDGYVLESAYAERIGDNDVLVTIGYSGKDITSDSIISVGDFGYGKELKDYEAQISTSQKKVFLVLRNTAKSTTTLPIRIYTANGLKSNIVSTTVSDTVYLKLINKQTSGAYTVYSYSSNIQGNLKIKSAALTNDTSKVFIENNTIKISKDVPIQNNKLEVTFTDIILHGVSDSIAFTFTRTIDLY